MNTIETNYTELYNDMFQGQNYSLYQGFIILEFLCLLISLITCSVTFYLVVLYPQFHQNLTGLSGDMVLAYFVLAITRIVRIVASGFNPFQGKTL